MSVLTAIIVIASLATVAVLLSGIGSMAHGGQFDRSHSHQFMFARVGLQGLTLLLLILALAMSLK